jgi:3-oxoacyl-[acyl-carrier protein] reductase
MDLGLEGRVALVAAASKGLGRAIAEELAREGARLMICARGEEALMQARAAIEDDTGAQVLAEPADVSSPADVVRVVEACAAALGPVDILVTNAGGPPAGPFESHSPEAWRDAVALNLESTVNLCRAVLPAMKERRWGRILNVTSIAVKQPVENLILSNSVRAAVTGFARTLANEVAPYGVTVNNLMPGYTRTERLEELAERNAQLRGSDPAEERSRWEREIPMGRLGEPREFAALAAFLASERASYITAQSIAVDGGWIRSLL